MQSFFLDTGHFDLVRVDGSDAERFLQGQLTCDVGAIPMGGSVPGAACNNKGRVIAPFLLYRLQDRFLLVFMHGLGDIFMSALRKFLPFYKCSMTPEADLACIGLAGETVPLWLSGAGCPDLVAGDTAPLSHGWLARATGDVPQYLFCGDRQACDTLIHRATGALARDNGTFWQAACLLNGHYPFNRQDSELYTPQELHYEQKQYVSFSKGCYTGQEIVARMHYRGKIKKQFYRVTIPAGAVDFPGNPGLFDEQGALLSECTKMTQLPDGEILALAQLNIEFASAHGEVRIAGGQRARLQPF